MARKRRRKQTQESDDYYDDDEPRRSRSRRSRNSRSKTKNRFLPRKWMFLLGLLALLLIFLPTIVANTPLKQFAVNRATKDFKGDIKVGKVSCGWLAQTRIHDIEATDEKGEMLFRVEQVQLSKSISSLINAQDYGTVTITNPEANLVVRPDGSNLEDAIADFLKTDEEASSPKPVSIIIENAQATITDSQTGRKSLVSQVNGTVDVNQPENPLVMELKGQVSDNETTGQFETSISIDQGAETLAFQAGDIEFMGQALPIDVATPILTRFVEPVTIGGVLDGTIKAAWTGGGSSLTANMEPARISNLVLLAPKRIGDDSIRLDDAWLQGNVSMNPGGLQAKRFICRTEVATLEANGEMRWSQLAGVAGAQIPANDFQAEGKINLAPLCAMLPNTLPLQQGLKIESGTVDFTANSKMEGVERRLVFNVESAGLTAIRDQQRINWHKPVRLAGSIRQTDNAMIIESLDCETNFLRLNGTATTEQGEFRVEGDLKSALAEATRFFDLGETKLEGQIDGVIAWRFDGQPGDALNQRPLQVGGRFVVNNPLVHLPGKTSWQQDQLNVLVQGAGQMIPVEPTSQSKKTSQLRMDSGHLELVNQQQTLTMDLLEPVLNPSLKSSFRVSGKLAGETATWLSQLSSLVPIKAQVSGTVDISADMTANLQHIAVNSSNYKFNDVRFDGYGVRFEEQEIVGEAQLGYSLKTGQLKATGISLQSSIVSALVSDLAYEPPVANGTSNSTLGGQVAFQANVNRMMTVLTGPPKVDSVQWAGTAEGKINLATADRGYNGNLDVRVVDLVAAKLAQSESGFQNVSSGEQWVRLLDEKQVDLKSTIQMSNDFNLISFQNLDLLSSAARVQASGTVSDPTGVMQTSVTGSWQPDWNRLKPLLDAYVGTVVQLVGVQGGAFRVEGPVFNPQSKQAGQPWLNPQLQVVTEASWQSATVLGLPVGNSRLKVSLNQGVAAIDTDPIPFSGGRVNLAPRLDMRSAQTMLYLPAGTIVETVELSPEICRGWLKFVAPALADATEAQGKFSVATSEIHVPIDSLTSAHVQGTMTMHNARIGPGPLGRQLITLVTQVKSLARGQALEQGLGQALGQGLGALGQGGQANVNQTWMEMPEQQVEFEVQQGRVYHQGMKFKIDDVIVSTTGSVGLDQTMQMVAEVPIQDSWLGGSQWTQGIRGQTLRIPIGGTVSSPQLDKSGLQQLSQQLIQQAATGAINNEVQGLIQKGNDRLEKELMNGLKGFLNKN